MEFSLTQIVDRPMAGRQFFEEVIRDNLDLGRPDRIAIAKSNTSLELLTGEPRRCTQIFIA
jgi:hypothetical protein